MKTLNVFQNTLYFGWGVFEVRESPRICQLLKNNGTRSLRGLVFIIFQEWTDSRTFSYAYEFKTHVHNYLTK